MDKNLLVYCIKRSGKTREDIAKALGISLKTLTNKILGHSEFTASEIRRFAYTCNLSSSEIVSVFFADNVE